MLITDIDGCLTRHRWAPLDIQALAKVAALCPELIMASGRSQPYMECLSQVLTSTSRYPIVCENGAAIFDPCANIYIWIDPAAHSICVQREAMLNSLRELSWKFFPEPAKDFSLSLTTMDAMGKTIPPSEAYEVVSDFLKSKFQVEITYSNSAIDVVGQGVHKGKALHVLAEHLNLPVAHWLGFGDGINDLTFLRMVGYSGAPLNADPAVRESVNWVAQKTDVHGLLDFLQHTSQLSFC